MSQKTQKPKNPHYVSNKEFYREMVVYLAARESRLERGEEPQELPAEIAEKIIKIAYRSSNRPNFRNYSFINEMISDGIETCFRYIYKFDPQKSDNPFSYFSQVCENAFKQRIKLEKRQANIKTDLVDRIGLDMDMTESIEDGGDDDHSNQYVQQMQELSAYADESERRKNMKSPKEQEKQDSTSSPLEEFLGK